MNSKAEYTIVSIPIPHLGAMWPHVGPHLVTGLAAADGNLQQLIDGVFDGEDVVWAIFKNDAEVVGAFVTTVLDDEGGPSLDVYGLCGSGIGEWGKLISSRMADVASASGCRRITFCGQRGLLRLYDDVKIVGEHSPGVFKFERVVA